MNQIRYTQRICTDQGKIEALLGRARTGVLAMVAEGLPYAVPVNFVWYRGAVYFHGMGSGRKDVILSQSPPISFTVYEEYGTVTDPVPCHADTSYLSVMLFGTAEKLSDFEEAAVALQQLADKYLPQYYHRSLSGKFIEKYRSALDGRRVAVYRLKPLEITAKENAVEEERYFIVRCIRDQREDCSRKEGPMEEKIGMMMDSCGQIASLRGNGIIKVFRKESEHWMDVQEIAYRIEDGLELPEIQEELRAIVRALDDCRILISSKIRCIPGAILEGLGMTLWEATGKPELYFDSISAEIAKMAEGSITKTVPTPVARDNQGHYFLDLRRSSEDQGQEHVPSQKILKPFFQNVSFEELEILCDHVPCWFEQDLSGFKLQAEVEAVEDETVKVRIVPLRGN